MLLAFTLILIIAQLIALPLIDVMAHVALVLLAYFMAAFLGERYWVNRHLPQLSATQRTNYHANLNRSIVFPYNMRYLKATLLGSRQRDKQ